MSRAFYLNLAVDNLKKNARTIIPYILTSVLTTMMLYMVVSLANNPHLNEIVGGASIKQLLCRSVHVGQQGYFLNTQRIDNDMNMDIAAVVVSVWVGADKIGRAHG